MHTRASSTLRAVLIGAWLPVTLIADDAPDELPALETIIKGYERVDPADGGENGMYTLYYKKDTHDLLAVLPKDHEDQRFLLANTLAAGFFISGVQSRADLLYWKRYGNRIALVAPQLAVRTTGDVESQRSREQLYSDMVRLDIPIVAEDEDGAPVIDLDDLFIDQSVEFHKFSPGGLVTRLGEFSAIKVFPENITLSVRMPWRMREIPPDDGILITLTYSMSLLPAESTYEPREADNRVGYFHTKFEDLARIHEVNGRRRYIHRWHLEKADDSLDLSPPKEPIVFYIDHKTPIRYRRWVRDGIMEWNEAFEQVGIVNAIEVRQQDARSGAHMEKDPENVQYNFVLWNSNDVGFAIGPSRVDPRTGQILDADVVFNDGWIRAGAKLYRERLADMAMDGMGAESRAWLAAHPNWDPMTRLGGLSGDAGRTWMDGQSAGGDAPSLVSVTRHGGRGHFECGAAHGRCRYGDDLKLDMMLARLSLLDVSAEEGKSDDDDNDKAPGIPLEFVGALVRDVITHEIGHVLGLRHNFKGSMAYSLEQINSPEQRGNKGPISASVMDYNAVNYGAMGGGDLERFFVTTLGPYDHWAIRYGYADDDDLEAILAESVHPEHAYLTDEDIYGPDPTARTGDLGDDPLASVDTEMAMVHRLRASIIERSLKKGMSYQRARDAYLAVLGTQVRNLTTAIRYVGGVYVHRDRVGDAERPPTEVVSPETQRQALKLVLRYAFEDEAFGLTPELLDVMSYDKWMDGAYVPRNLPDPQLDVHDLILGVQAANMTALLDPTRLRRIFDNEQRLPPGEDAFTLAELFDTVQDGVWRELDAPQGTTWTPRTPLISSLRRNLQREHLERLIDLALMNDTRRAAHKQVAGLAAHELRGLGDDIARVRAQLGERLDVYSVAHLDDAGRRIEQALGAMHVYK